MTSEIKSKTAAMANENIPRLILRYFASTFTAIFFGALYSLIDALFVSRGVGDNAMGGVSIVFPFMVIQAAIAQTVGGGAASIVSQLLGKKANEKAGEVTVNAMAVFYASAIVISIIGLIFINPILSLLGATNDVLPFAKEYITIILLGNVFSTGFSSIIRAEGRMTYSLLIWLIPTAVNIVFDAVFIFVLDMGVKGAAAATVLCQFTSFVMCVIFFSRLSSQSFKGARIRFSIIKDIIGIGIPTLIQLSSFSVISILLNNILADVAGTIGVNSFAYISKFITFGTVPFKAVSQAAAPVIGYNHGAHNTIRIRKTVTFSLTLSLFYAVSALVLIQFISELLISIFTYNSELIASASNGLRIISAALPFLPISLFAGTYFQAIGKKLPSIMLNLSILIFLLPISALFSKLWGINGIWWSFAPSCAAAAIMTGIFVFVIGRHKNSLA